MKNIHVIPTTEATNLIYHNGRYELLLPPEDKETWNNNVGKYIYITSDEQIKEGDWFICLEHSIEDWKFNSEIAQRLVSKQNKELFEGWINGVITSDLIGDRLQGNYQIEYCKKIILTTDLELIKNGVQPIDDEFLVWFVTHPTCEFVETFYGLYNPIGRKVSNEKVSENHSQCVWKHKIIIQKEEQKQHLIDMMKQDEELRLYEEPKQSTKDRILSETLKETKQKARDYGNSLVKKQITLEEKLQSLVSIWQKRQIHYEDVAQDNITSGHNYKKFTYKAMGTRDCWKELLTLLKRNSYETRNT